MTMAGRQVSVLVADDALYSLVGKLFLNGIYTTDIIIPTEPTTGSQLVFMFLIEVDIDDPIRSLTLEVTLPGADPVQMLVPVFDIPVVPGRTTMFYRWPLLIQSPVLRPGKIQAKIIHENGELTANAPWIVLSSPKPSVAH